MDMRIERDKLGEVSIPQNALYGINSARARENFGKNLGFNELWYRAMGAVKLAVYQTYRSFKEEVEKNYPNSSIHFPLIEKEVLDVIEETAGEIYRDGAYFENFIVPSISGGAGTSINLCVCEIIANVSLLKLGKSTGDYHIISPIETANVFQSTNDVVPTALRLAAFTLLDTLEESINTLRNKIEALEKKYRLSLRNASTEMQKAVPSSYGALFSAYNDALSRDWWRVSKCRERLKTVNLGGSAVGSAIGAPRYFVLEVVRRLQIICSLPISRAENLHDATSNLDTFVEVHAILKANAVNLEKISSDIMLLSSSLFENPEVEIPSRQKGSSIMPGKVNPVIAEYCVSIAHKVYANDVLITTLCGKGVLDLNAYIPIIGDAILESLSLLTQANNSLATKLFSGLSVNSEKAYEKLIKNPAITTALLPIIGYNKAEEIACLMKEESINIFEANDKLKIINKELLEKRLSAEEMLRLGYSVSEILKDT